MLSIAAMSAGSSSYYGAMAAEREPDVDQSPAGWSGWFGRGAGTLGLADPVRQAAFDLLFSGRGPSGDPIVQVQHYQDGRARQPGWDLTFSAPKSVSVLWSLCDPEQRQVIEAAHRVSVSEALNFLEQEAAFTRRGEGGVRLERCGLVVAMFEHYASRNNDPQLHTHALVLNLALRDDGSFGTLRSHDLYDAKMAAGTLYRAELAAHLVASGLQVVATETWFQIAGVPTALCDALSSRRETIQEALHDLGMTSPRAADLAALSTRQAKAALSTEELRAASREAAAHFGFDRTTVTASLNDAHHARTAIPTHVGPDRAAGALAEALGPLEAAGKYRTRDLVRSAAGLLQDGSHQPGSLLPALKALQSTHQEPALGVRQTPWQRQRTEQLLVAIGATTAVPPVPRRRVEAAIRKATKRGLIPEQRAALEDLLSQTARVRGFTGATGSGKSEVLQAAHKAWASNGDRVLALAADARGASEFRRQTGIPTKSLGQLERVLDATWVDALGHHAKQMIRAAIGWKTYAFERIKLDSRSVVILEGAEKLGPHQLERLLDRCTAANAQLVLVGDGDTPSAFQVIADTQRWKSLESNHRARPTWLREALADLESGNSAAGLSYLQSEQPPVSA